MPAAKQAKHAADNINAVSIFCVNVPIKNKIHTFVSFKDGFANMLNC